MACETTISMMHLPKPPPFTPRNQPLPANPYSERDAPLWHKAYQGALAFQEVDPLRSRVLGYVLLEALTPKGRDNVAEEIIQRGSDHIALHSLAQVYIDYLIHFFYRWNSDSVSETDDSEDEFCSDGAGSGPQMNLLSRRLRGVGLGPNSQTTKAKAFRRDDYRCMLTRHYDFRARNFIEELPTGASMTYNVIAYIVPPRGSPRNSLFAHDVDGSEYQKALDVVTKFCGDDRLNDLKGPLVHRLSNIMTVSRGDRANLDQLRVWLQKVPDAPDPNTYFTCSFLPGILAPYPSRTLTLATSETDLELPDPRFLELHAAVCRIGCLSGVASCLDSAYNTDLYRDSMGVLMSGQIPWDSLAASNQSSCV